MYKQSVNYRYSPFVNQIRENIIEEAKNSQNIEPWFLDEHLMEVEHLANLLCDDFQNADRDLVGLGVWFHDIGRLRGQDENHDVVGAEIAKETLLSNGVSKERAKRVYDICRSHRCSDVMPKSLEAKILATADAMSHFKHSFYIRLIPIYMEELTFEEAKLKVLKKINRDYKEKIAFDQARDAVKEKYVALRLILED